MMLRQAVVVAAAAALTLTACTPDDPAPTATGPTGPSTVSAFQHTELVGYFNDGIAPDEYPPVAESRGPGYPQALVMRDWVWDRVGPKWALVLVAGAADLWEDQPHFALPVLYLVSPEGVYFELPDISLPRLRFPTLVSWREDERTAVVTRHNSRSGTGNYVINLDSGAAVTIEVPLGAPELEDCAGVDWGYPVAAGASGRELWRVGPCIAMGGLRYETFREWKPEGGWAEAFADPQDVQLYEVSPDGRAVAFQVSVLGNEYFPVGPRSGPANEVRIMVYSLETGEDRLIIPTFPSSEPEIPYYQGWLDSSTIGFRAGGGIEDVGRLYAVSIDGSSPAQLVDEASQLGWVLSRELSVTPYGWPITLVSERNDDKVYEVRMSVGGREVVAASWRDYLLRQGHRLRLMEELAPGIYRVTLENSVVLGLDTVTGEVVAYISARDADGARAIEASHVFFDEGTRWTWW